MKNNLLVFSFAVLALIITSCGASKKNAKANNEPAPYIEPTTNRVVQLYTEFGNVTIALSDSTPQHRDNFIKLVKQHFFDSLLFHRVINTFMIQGGDPESKYAKPGIMLGNGGGNLPRIPAEFNKALFHRKGALAAARDGNPAMASSNCQFYIVQGKTFSDVELDQMEMQKGRKYADSVRYIYKTEGGTPQLDMGYTVFGQVTDGLEVIDKIAVVATDQYNRPRKDVRMQFVILH
jgi:cyclophilin family peptidyl-prolyl cis-trans isomerase